MREPPPTTIRKNLKCELALSLRQFSTSPDRQPNQIPERLFPRYLLSWKSLFRLAEDKWELYTER